jgi:hypothetical protein
MFVKFWSGHPEGRDHLADLCKDVMILKKQDVSVEVKGKVKVKLSLCFLLIEHHTMKVYLGSEGIAPLIL